MTGSPRPYAVVEWRVTADRWRAVCRSLGCVRDHAFWHMEWTDRERADADAADHNTAAHRDGAAT